MGSNILNCSFTALYRSAEFEQEEIRTKEWQPDHFGLCEKSKLVFCYQNFSDLLWEKNCSNDCERLLKFEAEGRELAKFLISLEQFIQTVN